MCGTLPGTTYRGKRYAAVGDRLAFPEMTVLVGPLWPTSAPPGPSNRARARALACWFWQANLAS